MRVDAPAGSDHAHAERIAQLAKLLGDPIRVRILDVLADSRQEVCQCELQPLFQISQPTLSHHLRKLEDADLIEVQRRGRWAYYALRPRSLDPLRAWLA